MAAKRDRGKGEWEREMSMARWRVQIEQLLLLNCPLG